MTKPRKFEVSTRRYKKYSVVTPLGKRIHFGDTRYEHYKDSTGTGAWTHLDHDDPARRALYRARHRNIKKDGKPAYLNPESPAFYSWNYLW